MRSYVQWLQNLSGYRIFYGNQRFRRIDMKHYLLIISISLILMMSACASKQAKPLPPVDEPVTKPEKVVPPKKELSEKDEEKVEKKEPVAEKKPVKKPEKPKPEKKAPADPCILAEGLVLIGELEQVYIKEAKMKLTARVDTGATTSSISADDIVRFERDGDKWVRFVIRDNKGKKSELIEKPLSRIVRIKQHDSEGQRRLVVDLQILMGPIRIKREFSLTDRSDFKYPVLIGRNVLRSKAAVDVGHKYLTSPMSE